MYNDVNLDNRLRYQIRGRVVVATTSPHVEYVNHSLMLSFPLYNRTNEGGEYKSRNMLVFTFEGEGYLSFSPKTVLGFPVQIKILEVGPFEKFDYNPQLFNTVEVTDDFISQITYSSPEYPSGDVAYTFRISYSTSDGNGESIEIQRSQPPYAFPVSDFYATFGAGKRWHGLAHYQGWKIAQI